MERQAKSSQSRHRMISKQRRIQGGSSAWSLREGPDTQSKMPSHSKLKFFHTGITYHDIITCFSITPSTIPLKFPLKNTWIFKRSIENWATAPNLSFINAHINIGDEQAHKLRNSITRKKGKFNTSQSFMWHICLPFLTFSPLLLSNTQWIILFPLLHCFQELFSFRQLHNASYPPNILCRIMHVPKALSRCLYRSDRDKILQKTWKYC